MQIKVKTPAKINLCLEVLNVREDGFHNIASIMQTISLYDYLDFGFKQADELKIQLTGNSVDIPYDKKNIVYKAITLFYSTIPDLPVYEIKINIEKNIPVQAGLGGGSANAAGVIWTLNKVLNTNLPEAQIDALCAKLGSDLNVCYHGGTCYAESRGEKITRIRANYQSGVSIIKPLNLGITAKDGYSMYDGLGFPPKSPVRSQELKNAIIAGMDISDLIYNDLEIAPLEKFEVLSKIKESCPASMMTGSGSAFFVLNEKPVLDLPADEYRIITGLNFVDKGVCEV